MFLAFTICLPDQALGAASEGLSENDTRVTLTVGNKVVPAVLYNNTTAKALEARLPVTVSLNRGPVDYCGGIDPLDYGEDDVQTGYRSGDLAYWIPGQDFVIFSEKDDTSSGAGAPDLVVIGQIRSDIEEIKDLGSTIKVTIALDR
jgi:hypothetical protein